ncbi:hexose phosphate transporter [Mycoplasma zalophidermidis]|uniref:MFS transporter n=1 Tax=Mycoplasma zalophidermidis TaxID=398174 RepID=A0ABS6DSP4_9MOLU|nr:hexose phosphate transporter [Mycoplasma zalophidermidis]MBU4689600.1 MFS transporter [Mycoplasma zalophidermidis]MBU4693498.1 MFS transporter [Mycoplasma zalophidermidis]MCR8966542.1 MFS transporter [Mycoplasma zalophidermidis]
MNNSQNNTTTPTSSPRKNKTLYGIFLWAVISFAYLLFVINWGFSIGLNGSGIKDGVTHAGVLGHFKIVSDTSFALNNSATNWAITFGRGIGSVMVALLLVRFAHKKTTIIALILTLFGILAQFMPAAPYGYVLYLLLRTLMAIGGTMMIILTQPIVANFFTKKQKSIASQFGIWFYPLGTIISIVPFVFISKLDTIQNNWQVIFTVLAALNIIPLLIFIFMGSKFDVTNKTQQSKTKEENAGKILLGYLKQKQTYVWVMLFGGWLAAVVFPTSLSINFFADLAGVKRSLFTKEIRIWYILFLAAVFIGPISVGLWSRYNLKRRWFVATIIGGGILFYVLSTIIFIFGIAKQPNGSAVRITSFIFFYVFGFLAGLCLWGIQGVILNLPHEYKDTNPKTVGWMFSLIWGFGYMFFTLCLIIISCVPLVGGATNSGNNFTYALIGTCLIVLMSLIAVIGALLIKEPSPDAKTFPSWSKK